MGEEARWTDNMNAVMLVNCDHKILTFDRKYQVVYDDCLSQVFTTVNQQQNNCHSFHIRAGEM